ncbi:MAG TPA: NfeD family protein [Gemmataceae bacterium]|nr:NfeD family protein [Gemmataceae bacterium]
MESSYLTLGLALVAAGFLLLAAELFIPTGGVLFVLSVSGIALGVALTFLHGTTAGLCTLVGVFVAAPVFGALLMRIWPRTPLGKRFFLTGPDENATVAALPANQELEQLKGRIGRTLSALRPAGVVDFDGRRIDTVTEGMMVDPGQWVRCVDVRAGRVVVRPVDRPDLGRLESDDFG